MGSKKVRNSGRGTPNAEVDSDYGLRKRSERNTGNSELDLQRQALLKRGPTVWEKFPNNSGFHALTKQEVKGDLREISVLTGTDLEKAEMADEVESKASSDSKAKGRKRLIPSGGKNQPKVNKSEKRKPPSTMQDSNFFYAYSRTRNFEEELDYKDFVSEQKYLSTRHAYVKKLEAVQEKSKEHHLVLDTMREQLLEAIHGESGLIELSACRSVLDQAITSLVYYREKVENLRAENRALRENTNAGSSPTPKQEVAVPSETANEDGNTESMDLDETSVSKTKSQKVVEQKGKLTSGSIKVDSRYVRTRYGPGWVQEIRLDGTVKVKLLWGAEAVLHAESLSPASIDELGRAKSTINQALRSRIRDLDSHKNRHRYSDSQVEDVEGKEPVTLYTRIRYGPPRGVELFLSPVSDDPHFALPSAKPMNPEALRKTYDNVPRYKSYDVSFPCDEVNPIYDQSDYEHNDWDWRTHKRVNDLKYMPVSWGEPTSSPWASEGLCPSRKELTKWEQERNDYLKTKAAIRSVKHELQKAKTIIRLRDKRLVETNKTQNVLMDRLTILRNNYVSLRKKCAKLLRGIPEENDDDSESKSSESIDENGNSQSATGESERAESPPPNKRASSNGSSTGPSMAYTTRRTRAANNVNGNGKSAFETVDDSFESQESDKSKATNNSRKRERGDDSLLDNEMYSNRRSTRIRRSTQDGGDSRISQSAN